MADDQREDPWARVGWHDRQSQRTTDRPSREEVSAADDAAYLVDPSPDR